MASVTLESSPNLYDFGQWNGQNSHELGRHSTNVWLLAPQPGGCVAQDFEDRSLKTQTQVRFGDVGMAAQSTNLEKNSSGYEERVILRNLLSL